MNNNENSVYIADAAYNTIGNIVYFFSLWVITVLVVRLSGYNDAGILSVAMTTSNVFFVIANYGMRSFQASDVNIEYSDSQYLASRYFTTAIGIVLCICFSIYTGYNGRQFIAIILYMLFKSWEALADVLYGILQRMHKLKIVGISFCVKGLLNIIGFCMGMIITNNLLLALVLMNFSSISILLCVDFYCVYKYSSAALIITKNDKKNIINLLNVCFSMFLVSVAPMILQAIPKLIFERKYTTEEFGVYSTVASPTLIISTLVSCIIIPFLPKFAEFINKNERKKLLHLFLSFSFAVLVLGVIACLLAWLVGGQALSILYGRNMYEYKILFICVICSVTLTSLLYCLNSLFISGRKIPILAIIYFGADIFCYSISEKVIIWHGIYGITDLLIIIQLSQCIVLSVLAFKFFFTKNKEELDVEIT